MLASALLALASLGLAHAAPYDERWVDYNINTNTGQFLSSDALLLSFSVSPSSPLFLVRSRPLREGGSCPDRF